MTNLSATFYQPTTGRLTTDRTSVLCRVGLYYQGLDPFAVTVMFDSKTWWRISRDYLAAGLAFEAGTFDVRIRRLPGLVRVWQWCESGWTALDLDDDVVSNFLATTTELVPEGEEFGFCPANLAELETA